MYRNNIFNIQIALLIFLLILLSGCTIVRSINTIYNKDVKTKNYTLGNKSIIISPISHIGQKIFYSSLKDSIIDWKNRGYTIFYEEIRTNNLDSTELKNLMLKWRKINNGNIYNREHFANLSRVFNKIVQPEYNQLGIDSTDINADVGIDDIINKYEELYGIVQIDSCDYSTPLNSVYCCNERLKNNLKPILCDYREQQVVERIINTDLTKIVVLYGASHIKNIKKSLKKNNR